jgi:hypothetical protein
MHAKQNLRSGLPILARTTIFGVAAKERGWPYVLKLLGGEVVELEESYIATKPNPSAMGEAEPSVANHYESADRY